MNQDKLNDLKKNLWEVADELRANSGLKASAYSFPEFTTWFSTTSCVSKRFK